MRTGPPARKDSSARVILDELRSLVAICRSSIVYACTLGMTLVGFVNRSGEYGNVRRQDPPILFLRDFCSFR